MDEAIEDLRRELAAFDVDPRVVDELVDHVASTIEARLAVGDSLDQAVSTARSRLGDVRAIAREHTKVALPFGPRPSRWIAWPTAIAMLAWPMFVVGSAAELTAFVLGWGAIRTLAILGLAARSPQATAVVHGIACAELLVVVANDAVGSVPVFAISAGAAVVLAARSTALRWAMFAVGCMVPPFMFGIASPLRDTVAIAWILAAAGLALRLRVALPACTLLAVLVAHHSYTAIAYGHELGQRIGFAAWLVLDLIASAAMATAGVAVLLLSMRCNRGLRSAVDGSRFGRS